MVPLFQFLTNLSEAHAILDTDWPMSLHMNEASFFMHTSCHAADKELVAAGEKHDLRCVICDILAC